MLCIRYARQKSFLNVFNFTIVYIIIKRNINAWRIVWNIIVFLSTGNPPTLVDNFSSFFFCQTTVSHLPLIIRRTFVSPFVEKTDVGTYDIMFGRGWLCIIERGWLFWYSWAVRRLRWFVPLLQRKPARNVRIQYYNNNINILYNIYDIDLFS